MIYATLREALYDFFTHNAPLVSAGGYYSSEDVFTALPYAKGRRYFDAVALCYNTLETRLHQWKNSIIIQMLKIISNSILMSIHIVTPIPDLADSISTKNL